MFAVRFSDLHIASIHLLRKMYIRSNITKSYLKDLGECQPLRLPVSLTQGNFPGDGPKIQRYQSP